MPKIKTNKNIYFIAVLGLLIFLHLSHLLRPAENFLFKIVSPIMDNLYFSSGQLKSAYLHQVDKRDLNKIVQDLEQKNQLLLSDNSELIKLKQENKYLREHLEFKEDADNQQLMANIISRSDFVANAIQEMVLIIDVGEEDGVLPGLLVLNKNGVVVGKIKETKKNSSKVYLTIDSNCRLAVSVQNSDRTFGIAEGDMGLTIGINFIPQSENINVGDIAVTSGLEKGIPAGFAVGKVSRVDRENNELWQNVSLDPLFNFNDLLFVSVILSDRFE